MFYERYLQLCQNSRLSPSAAATNAGFNRGTVSVWKKKYEAGEDVNPEPETVEKICVYFKCSETWLRGIDAKKETPTPEGERNELKERVYEAIEATDPATREVVLRLLGLQ